MERVARGDPDASIPAAAFATIRGCGTRQRGGVYWTLGLGGEAPWHRYLVDPPLPLPPGFPCPAQGVALFEDPRREGVYHLVDRVGRSFYPFVSDFVEEFRRFGVSRRLQRSLDFSRLSPESRLYLIHDRAYHSGWSHLEGYPCPCGKTRETRRVNGLDVSQVHSPWAERNLCCAGFWWWDLELENGGGRETVILKEEGRGRIIAPEPGEIRVARRLPGFSYAGRLRPGALNPRWDGDRNPETGLSGWASDYRPAIFARVPLSALEVVRDPAGTHERALAAVDVGTGLPIRVRDH